MSLTQTQRETQWMTVPELIAYVQDDHWQPCPSALHVSIAFTTLQCSRHVERQSGYVNRLVSLRVGTSVGTCYFEDGELEQATVDACVGQSVAVLLAHPALPIRIAALDAYLGEVFPHDQQPTAHPVIVPAGTSVTKSLFRARSVVDLLNPQPGQRVALIGIVNSLVQALRERDAKLLGCDYNISSTEWGEPVTQHMEDVLQNPDLIIATGMTLGNGTFDTIVARARDLKVPLVIFAQTGSAVVPQFLTVGVHAVSAEPYPFFWVSGGPTTLYQYYTFRSNTQPPLSYHSSGTGVVMQANDASVLQTLWDV